MKLVSLFSGAGGLDHGFETIWANEYDRVTAGVWERNFENGAKIMNCLPIDKVREFPKADGVVGGPPCQSFSIGGAKRGVDDPRSKLFYSYVNAIKVILPKFFLAENVSGLFSPRNRDTYDDILRRFRELGYLCDGQVLDAVDYGVPQNRKRLFILGYRSDLGISPTFSTPLEYKLNLLHALTDVPYLPVLSGRGKDSYSSQYMTCNRVRKWLEPSYTIVATRRSNPKHPDVTMIKDVGIEQWVFGASGSKRLSAIECARIQTFSDTFN
jgi:DNA-methyltransferase (dcm)